MNSYPSGNTFIRREGNIGQLIYQTRRGKTLKFDFDKVYSVSGKKRNTLSNR